MGAGLFGSTYLLPVFVQQIQGYTPLLAGLLLMPGGLLGFLISRRSAARRARTGMQDADLEKAGKAT